VPGQAEAVIVDGNNVTRFVLPANGAPATISTTTVQQRQAEQAINKLAADLQALKKLEQPSDSQKRLLDDLKAQLTDKLDEQFKETQKAQIDEVAKLRERLDNLQKEITERSKNREDILSQRIEDLLSGKIPATTPAAGRRGVRVGVANAVPIAPGAVPVAGGVDHAPAAVPEPNPLNFNPVAPATPPPPAAAQPANAADAPDTPPGATKR
jgi:hypothetical protein